MGIYGGIKGEYNYRRKEHAVKAQKAAREKGRKTRLTGSRGAWTLTVR